MQKYKLPSPLKLEGNIAKNWARWKQRFQLYLEVSELDQKEEKLKCSVLLHMTGDDGLELYDTFKYDNEANRYKFDNLMKRFEE